MWWGGKGLGVITPMSGQVMRLGLIYLEILSPSEQLSINNYQLSNGEAATKIDTNANSVVSLVSFGNFKALLTGDIPPGVSDRLSIDSAVGQVDYIKVSHHGSKNGITDNLLKVLVPKVAVISVGKNPWGFPHQEILDLLNNQGIKILRTDQLGDIEVITDGKESWIRK